MVATDEITIGELSQRTGIQPATLRAWEARYGFPTPTRSAAGQRRYPANAADLVARVLAEQAAGRSLPSAIKQLQQLTSTGEPSLFALLRRLRPQLPVHRLRKSALVAISAAIEDECAATGPQSLLIGSFQSESNYRDTEHRWTDLARTAETAFVFADFTDPAGLLRHPMEIPFPPSHPLHREWLILSVGPRIAACLAGWEPPRQSPVNDAARTFDTVWTVERDVILKLATAACALASHADPRVAERLTSVVLPAAQDDELRSLTAVANRIVAYLAMTGTGDQDRRTPAGSPVGETHSPVRGWR